jgi:hypothetical protein
MRARTLAGILLGAIVSFILVVSHSQIVRSCGRPSWFDAMRGQIGNTHPAAVESGIDAPYGVVCDYFPSALESAANTFLFILFFLTGGGVAALICRRSAWFCGGGAAMLAAIVVEAPAFGLVLRELGRMRMPITDLFADTFLSLLAATFVGAMGGISVARVWPDKSVARTPQ